MTKDEEDSADLSLAGTIRSTVQVNPGTLGSRAYYSTYYLWSAWHFASRAGEIETREQNERAAFNIEHRAYVTAAVMSAVAFLEAAINEVFQDAVDRHHSYVGDLDGAVLDRFRVFWGATEQGKNASILKKYVAALEYATDKEPDVGTETWEDFRLVVEVRNLLVHFRPETSGPDDPGKLLRKLTPKKITENPFAGSGSAYFPDRSLSAAFARWCAASSKRFADQFFAQLNLTPNYQRHPQWTSNIQDQKGR